MRYMVFCNPGNSVFVKTREYFENQKGHLETWGKNWVEVEATSIEDARSKGCELFPEARSYKKQFK